MIGFVPVVLGLPVKRAIEFPSCHGNIAEKVIAIAPPPCLPDWLSLSDGAIACPESMYLSLHSPRSTVMRTASEGTRAQRPLYLARGARATRRRPLAELFIFAVRLARPLPVEGASRSSSPRGSPAPGYIKLKFFFCSEISPLVFTFEHCAVRVPENEVLLPLSGAIPLSSSLRTSCPSF